MDDYQNFKHYETFKLLRCVFVSCIGQDLPVKFEASEPVKNPSTIINYRFQRLNLLNRKKFDALIINLSFLDDHNSSRINLIALQDNS